MQSAFGSLPLLFSLRSCGSLSCLPLGLNAGLLLSLGSCGGLGGEALLTSYPVGSDLLTGFGDEISRAELDSSAVGRVNLLL